MRCEYPSPPEPGHPVLAIERPDPYRPIAITCEIEAPPRAVEGERDPWHQDARLGENLEGQIHPRGGALGSDAVDGEIVRGLRNRARIPDPSDPIEVRG